MKNNKDINQCLDAIEYAQELLNGSGVTPNIPAIETATRLSDEDYIKTAYQTIDILKNDQADNYRLLLNELTRRKRRRIVLRSGIAGSVAAALIMLSFLLFNPIPNEDEGSLITARQPLTELTKPILIVSQKSIADKLVADGKINDKEVDTRVEECTIGNNEEILNTLIIPRSQTYTMTLPDGTVVTLNANSEIRYPAEFSKDIRKVYLKGEAYFDVTKSETPFIVYCEESEIRVYGTSFNINAMNPNFIKMVLVSGSVGIKTTALSEEVMLKPQHMATIDLCCGGLRIDPVDSEIYIAWMYGYFRFDSQYFGDVLKELADWYNISFEIEQQDIKQLIITGAFLKDSSEEEVLSAICRTLKLNYTKKGGIFKIEHN